MSFGPQGEREWLEPLDETGSRTNNEHEIYGKATGCHVGRHEFLNIYGAQAGFTYVWERNNANDIRAALHKGGQLVRDDDPEMAAARAAAGETDFGTSVDSLQEYRELALVRYSEKAIRKIRGEEQRRARAYLTGGTEGYVAGRSGAEESHEYNPRGVPTRFATSDHRTEFRGSRSRHGDTINDQWTPDRGIID